MVASDEFKKMEMPENLPSSVYITAWAELYRIFGEQMKQKELDLMQMVLDKTISEVQGETKEIKG